MGWDNNVHVLYTRRHGNRHCSFIISYCWGEVGWGEVGWLVKFMFCTLAGTATVTALSSSVTTGVGWGGDDDDDDDDDDEADDDDDEADDDDDGKEEEGGG